MIHSVGRFGARGRRRSIGRNTSRSAMWRPRCQTSDGGNSVGRRAVRFVCELKRHAGRVRWRESHRELRTVDWILASASISSKPVMVPTKFLHDMADDVDVIVDPPGRGNIGRPLPRYCIVSLISMRSISLDRSFMSATPVASHVINEKLRIFVGIDVFMNKSIENV
jgi:hypothetical protein